jgi:hypothetical protein
LAYINMKRPLIDIVLCTILILLGSETTGQYCLTDVAVMGKGNPDQLFAYDELPDSLSGADWTTILGPQATSWGSGVLPGDFSFEFAGNSVSSYTVHPSGVLTFASSPGTVTVPLDRGLPSLDLPDSSVFVRGFDMRGFNDQVTATTIEGACGRRQHWVVFSSMSKPASVPADDFCWHYWAIVLEEWSNNIHIVDMRNSCPSTSLVLGVQVTAADSLFVQVGSSTVTPNAGTGYGSSDNVFYTFEPCGEFNLGMRAVEMTAPSVFRLPEAGFTLSGVFQNSGREPVNSFWARFRAVSVSNPSSFVDGREYISGLNLLPLQSTSVNFSSVDWWPSNSVGRYDITIWVDSVNGAVVPVNAQDSVSAGVEVVTNIQSTNRKPFFELFTSSTCDDCVSVNQSWYDLLQLDNNEYEVSILRYPACWPGYGDPYYTDEVGDRQRFYGITELPSMKADGLTLDPYNDLVQSNMDEWKDAAALANIQVQYFVDYPEVTANVAIDVVSDLISQNNKLHVAVFEYEVRDNASTNGETQFNHVFKKMIGEETLGSLAANSVENLTYTHSFATNTILPIDARNPVDHATQSTVERFWDLGVVAWIQDTESKRVIQSATGLLVNYTSVDDESNNLFLHHIYPNPANTSATLVIESKRAGNGTLKFFGSNGKLYHFTSLKIRTGRNHISVPTELLTPGLYMVQLELGGQQVTQRLSVHR